jgi:hypothetical protein
MEVPMLEEIMATGAMVLIDGGLTVMVFFVQGMPKLKGWSLWVLLQLIFLKNSEENKGRGGMRLESETRKFVDKSQVGVQKTKRRLFLSCPLISCIIKIHFFSNKRNKEYRVSQNYSRFFPHANF